MCRRVTCQRCGKPTWAGCGQHVEDALRAVPVDQRCRCERGQEPSSSGRLAGLFGRRPS